MSKTRVGIIGCGNRGRYHIRILKEFEDVEIVATCDPVSEGRRSTAEEFGIEQQYDSADEMLDAAELDAVFVTPPAHLNAVVALPSLERGVHAMIEKPPGLTIEETQGLKDAADRTGAKVVVGPRGEGGGLPTRGRHDPQVQGARPIRLKDDLLPVAGVVGPGLAPLAAGRPSTARPLIRLGGRRCPGSCTRWSCQWSVPAR